MSAALPPLNSTPISAETRLAYVLRHFQQAYEPMPTVSIGYEETDAIQLPRGDLGFFDGQRPYPPTPTQREWRNRQMPFFFDHLPGEPLLTLLEGKSYVGVDLISAAFYLLSGWQEYFSEERDQHGRFPFSASIQRRYGFVETPIVNYYFDILKTAVEHVTGQPLQTRRWANGAAWAAFITHDVDNLYSAWKAPAKAALRQGKLLSFCKQMWRHITQPDAWDNLTQVQQEVAAYGAKSTFFFLPEHRKAANGTPNADYRFAELQTQVQGLSAQGAEVGLHGSIGTSANLPWLQREQAVINKSPAPAPGLRFHYLSWEPRQTPGLVQAAAFAYDTTLGFAEHFGFRHSYCLPFQPFDFATGRACNFLEIPLNVMDATLYHPRYLQLEPSEIMSALTPMLQEIEQFRGVCTVLWHNENFDPANKHNGPQQFQELMEYLRSHNAAFVVGSDILTAMHAQQGK